MMIERIPMIAALLVISVIEAHAAMDSTYKYGRSLYTSHCAQCHGISGNGDGINASYLETQPARLNDAKRMRRLSDSQMADIIRNGGRQYGLSALMPGWRGRLSDHNIKLIVRHIRYLCRCSHSGEHSAHNSRNH